MTVFFAGAGLLLLVAAMVLLRRRLQEPRAADAADPNLAWYRSHSEELGDADPRLVEDAQLRLMEDGIEAGAYQSDARRGRLSTIAIWLLLAVGAGAVYWQTGALEDVLIYRQLENIRPEDGEAARAALLERIARRSEARPDNLQYLGLLGRLYMAGEDFGAAAEAYGRLAQYAPEDPQALAMAAQARFLAADRELDPAAQLYAERALAVDPRQRTALGLLGMASFEQGAYAAAANYWERLLDMEDPASPAYEMLSGVIAMARERGGLPSAAQTPADDAPEPGAAPGISVVLRLAEATSADPSATVFVFARPAAQAGGMPVAVRRLRAAELPVTLRLTDSDAMAGQRLSEAGSVMVTAQLSANGQPGEANALASGAAGPVEAGDSDVLVTIELGGDAASG